MVGGFGSRKQAEAALAQALAKTGRGELPRATDTVGAYLGQWLAGMRPQLSITAWSNDDKVLGLYVPEVLRRRQLATLTGPMMTALYAHLVDSGGRCGRPLSATTVRLVHRILHTALHDAVDAGLLAMNPADKAKPPKRVRAQTSVWTAEQAAAFLHQRREDRLAAAWLLALSCGLRRGELAGLRWQDVDLERCTLTVAQQRATDSGSHVVLKEPKGTSRRTLDLGRAATAALQAHLHAQRRERLALGRPLPGGDALVFCAQDGRPLHPQRITDLFQAAVREAGLTAHARRPTLLRHPGAERPGVHATQRIEDLLQIG